MRAALGWLHRRADNVAVGLLTAMFLTFIVQIFWRYVVEQPLGWTLEACSLTWLWVVFWTGAFLLEDRNHVRFDLLYWAVGRRTRSVFAVISALAIIAGFAISLPATADFVAFMKIEKTSLLKVRFDVVFSAFLLFSVAVIIRYAIRAAQILRGVDVDAEPDRDERA